MCGAAKPKKEIVPTVLTAAPISIAKAINAIRRTFRGSIPRCLAVVSPSESKSNLGAIKIAIVIPTKVKISNGIKSLEFVKASEPKLQNEIDLASEREIAVVKRPTIAEIVADSESPIITRLSGDTLRSRVAKRSVNSVANNAPTAAMAIAPTEPITTTFASTPITTANAAPAEVPKMAGSANGLLVAPCASAPATPSAAPTISAVAIRGIRICQRISAALVFAPGFSSAENKPSI